MNKTDQMSFFGFEAEPSAEPAAVKPVKAKAGKPAAPAVKLPDLVLAESAPPVMPAAQAPTLPQPPATTLPEPLDARAAPADEHEAMAQALAQHPDFRVLRRLVPHSDYGPVNGPATQRVIVLDTETTGLDSKNESIIELAMLSVLVDTATGLPVGPVRVYESFEDPDRKSVV